MKFLLLSLLSVLLIGCSSVTPAIKRNTTAVPSESIVWTQNFRSDSVMNQYSATIKTPDAITGRCYLKKSGNEWRGTFTTEMGAGKAFDFIVKDDRCELLNVISMMDKWYIKKTIAADLNYLFNVDNPNASFYKKLERFEQDGTLAINYKKKQILVEPDGTILLINNRRKLQYELRKIIE